ncbi:PP2C family protein-serine/threonine phosphatase [Atopomonas hussainii]|uniref:PP2C family protein-serine/threonine phosphatase n=1 Tax=Atopomonas hussainii TaxID=1429083 RepID=UPI0008FFFED8|nr:protein phosphatase 2C domain-containing protein [Atopomonas hussainii]
MSLATQAAYLDFCAHSVVGAVREHNEDAVLADPALGLWAVADGMGGYQKGELASALVIEALQSQLTAGATLEAAIQHANDYVRAEAEGHADRIGMGSTVVAARFDGFHFELAWVGDSRAYRVGAGYIEQLSHDHSWVQAMIDAGQLSVDEAREHPRRNIVTQCLGREPGPLQVGLLDGELRSGELLLLCSDGLTGELDDAQIALLAHGEGSLQSRLLALIGAAEAAGGHDNISCVLLARPYDAPPLAEARPWYKRIWRRG